MADNLRHAQYRTDGSQIDDPQKSVDLNSTQVEQILDSVSGAGIVAITADVTINAANAGTYDGRTLRWDGAFTVTLAAGLPDGFGFAGRPPASGNASVAVTGGSTIDGSVTTITRTLAANKLFAVQGISADTYTATGT